MDARLFGPALETLAAHLGDILVAVRGDAGGGSGTVWGSDGLVITNHHVAPAPADGLLVTAIAPGSPAERAGLLPGDVVLALGESAGVHAASRALRRMRPGAPVSLSLLRGGRLVEAVAEPAARN